VGEKICEQIQEYYRDPGEGRDQNRQEARHFVPALGYRSRSTGSVLVSTSPFTISGTFRKTL
jgi:hypothetical protein